MLKKVFSGFLAMTLACSMPMYSFAKDSIEISCEVSKENLKVGDVFYADFKVNENPTGYLSMQCFIDYNSDVIQAIDCDVEDIPSDLIIYTDKNDVNHSMFPYFNVNDRVNYVPKKADSDYLGKADGVKTAGEIGRIKLANLLNVRDEEGSRINYEGNGTLIRMKFKAIDEGESNIEMNDVIGSFNNSEDKDQDILVNVSSGSVKVSKDSLENTTESTTESTTTSQNGSSSGGSSGGGGGSSSSVTTTEANTSEATTESTTDVIIGGSDESTGIVVEKTFTDVSKDYWGYEYISKLANKGIVNGYPDGSFMPNSNVKRADFIIMVLKGIGVDTSQATLFTNFNDVQSNAYYANALAIAKNIGIAKGNLNGGFEPNSFITREDMMLIAKRALEYKLGENINGDVKVLDQFSDKNDVASYAVEGLSAMVSEGLVNGMNGKINPKLNTTRAQASVVIAKMLDKLN